MTDYIRPTAASAIEGWLGPEATIVEWSGPEQRDWSWQVSLHVAGPRGGDLVLKIPRWEEVPTLEDALAAGEQPGTRHELDGLRRIEAAVLASGDPGLTAVEPIGYLSELNGILMRRLDGVSLRERLGWGRGRGDVGAVFDRVGRWIKVFHDVDGTPEKRAFDVAGEVAWTRRLEAALQDRGGAPADLGRAITRLRDVLADLERSSELHCDVHGDLNASNVLVARDDRVAVIDPNRESAPALRDVARILTDVRLDRNQLISSGSMRPDTSTAAWEARLLAASGYGNEPTLRYRLAADAVARWAEVEQEVTGVGRLALPAGRRLLRSVVRNRLAAAG